MNVTQGYAIAAGGIYVLLFLVKSTTDETSLLPRYCEQAIPRIAAIPTDLRLGVSCLFSLAIEGYC